MHAKADDTWLPDAGCVDNSGTPVAPEVDLAVVDDDISDMEYLKSRMRQLNNSGVKTFRRLDMPLASQAIVSFESVQTRNHGPLWTMPQKPSRLFGK